MLEPFSRTQLLLGPEAMGKLARSRVAIFGIGGVGSYAAEALARGGVGHLALFDDDAVCITNMNRQLIALHSTVGQKKVDVMKARILDINPQAVVDVFPVFYGEKNADEYDLSSYTYMIDAIDTVSSKLILIERAKSLGIPIISCMGAGNKLDPTAFMVADIYKTSVCPLAKVMRRELRARKIDSLKVVYSKEIPAELSESDAIDCKKHCVCPPASERTCAVRRQIPGSISFVPSVAGLILAGEVIKEITGAREVLG